MSSIFKKIAKVFHSDSGNAVGEVALSEVQHAVAALKQTDIGKTVAADIKSLKDSTLSGTAKFEQVLGNTLPLIISYASGGGVSAVLTDVESIGRELVQSTFNDVASTKAGSIATAILAMFGKK